MKLIITRHGETAENAAGIIQGHLPGQLSEAGIKQAKKVAERLKNEKIDVIYCSDLARAADTAKEIAAFHKGIPLHLVKDLRERKHGVYEGKKRSEIDSNAEEVSGFTSITKAPPNGENWLQVYERARAFLDRILHKHRNKTVLVVSHGGLVRSLICVIKNKPVEEIFTLGSLSNTSISIFEINEKKVHKEILFNCTKHLE